ncbi:hypothetical protein [Natronococcus sp. A-GB7]|uniref:hypothetical protein n=1 Tax=Natronococcus sp. A-GB7 TaxID=3037649 RepID=UPI00241F1847|nr:hypothetical protein [Natronococcus sp. A-GB7]MDG5820199.1 hypothetical protein [Natronococcus sp. A-GB7]
MTKRRLERDLETLSDEVLAELDPGERNQYIFIAQAQDNDYWIERLHDTCPADQLGETIALGQLSLQFAFETVYDLHTIALQLELFETRNWARIFAEGDDRPSEAALERASDRADDTQAQFVALYLAYHGNRRFAKDVLGIEFETWLAPHKHGSMVIDLAEDTLADSSRRRLAEEWVLEEMELFADEPDDDPLDALVDNWAEHRIAAFQRLSAGIYSG